MGIRYTIPANTMLSAKESRSKLPMIFVNNPLFASAAAAEDDAAGCGPASVSGGVTVYNTGVFLLRRVPANIFIDLPIPDVMQPLPSSPAAPVPLSLSSRLLINQKLLSKEPEGKETGAPSPGSPFIHSTF